MVTWSEEGQLKLGKLWANNLVCLWHVTGFLFTIILLKRFSSDNLTCKDSFFAYYRNGTISNDTSSCNFTTDGVTIIVFYFILSGIGLVVFLLLFYYSIIMQWIDHDEIFRYRHILAIPFLIPTYMVALSCTIFFTIYPKIYKKSDMALMFSRKWMGYTKKEWTSWTIMVAQTAYMVENGLELAIGIGILLSTGINSYSIFYCVFAVISIVARFIVFGIRCLKTGFQYITHDFLGVCCDDIDKRSYGDV